MLKIGEFSKLSRISVRMLRYYDELGVLRPVVTDRDTGCRYYSEEQLLTAGRVAVLRDMGFGLAAVGELLDCYDDREELDRRLQLQLAELRALSAETGRRILLLETARQRLRKDENAMKYDVVLKTLPQRRAACVRMTIPCYEEEGRLWGLLMEETAPLDPVPDDPCYCCAVFHDGEHRERDVDVEVQKTVKGEYPDTEHVKFRTLPPVSVAAAVCKGPYDQMGQVNFAVAEWVRDNGYEYAGPVFNIYHVSPHETDDPEQFVTEVCYPVRKK